MIVQPLVTTKKNSGRYRAAGFLGEDFMMLYSFGNGTKFVSGPTTFVNLQDDAPITNSLVFVLPKDGSGRMPSYSNCEYIGQLYAGGAEGRMFSLSTDFILE